MARPINRLSARFVQTAGAGYHADGAGLYLLVTDEGTASWVFRYARHGRKREMGLGGADLYTLAQARQRRDEQRRVLAEGFDPIDHRKAARSATPRLWGEAAEAFILAHESEWKTQAQAAQWRQSILDYGPRADLPMSELTTAAVIDVLRPLWTSKTETATRLRGRIERIWNAEKVAGNVAGENPARWRGHLDHILARPSKVAKAKHHAAMPYADLPTFMATLRARDGLARSGLAFTILTAARTNETVGADWSEFDLRRGLWTLPPERMKAGEVHVVPLPEDGIEILRRLPKGSPPFPLSENGMLSLLQKSLGQPYTVHGFRSSFHDWASDNDWPEHVIDAALAHKVSDEVKAAYRRTKLMEQRRSLMAAWANFLQTRPDATARVAP
jgi:integrase